MLRQCFVLFLLINSKQRYIQHPPAFFSKNSVLNLFEITTEIAGKAAETLFLLALALQKCLCPALLLLRQTSA